MTEEKRPRGRPPQTDLDADLISRRMKAYRARMGLNQRELAAKFLTSPGVIGDMESGRIRSRRVAELAMGLE